MSGKSVLNNYFTLIICWYWTAKCSAYCWIFHLDVYCSFPITLTGSFKNDLLFSLAHCFCCIKTLSFFIDIVSHFIILLKSREIKLKINERYHRSFINEDIWLTSTLAEISVKNYKRKNTASFNKNVFFRHVK